MYVRDQLLLFIAHHRLYEIRFLDTVKLKSNFKLKSFEDCCDLMVVVGCRLDGVRRLED